MTDWEARFSEPGYAYGTEPNDFLKSHAGEIPAGRVLSLADGEGRNSIFLAEQGHKIVAVDRSPAGLAKAAELAARRGVVVERVLADLAAYEIAAGAWSGIVAIFAHLPPPLRERIHREAVAGLKPGGVFLLEAYAPGQLRHSTGGPRELQLLMSAEGLRKELAGLEFLIAREVERDVVEGRYHRGLSAVVQILARKPKA